MLENSVRAFVQAGVCANEFVGAFWVIREAEENNCKCRNVFLVSNLGA